MAKSEEGSFWKELASASLYKRNQGLLARRLTAAGFGLIVFVGAWTLAVGPLHNYQRSAAVYYGVPLLIAAAGAWVTFRLVNYPRFAEFLISVEGEMNKVSWAGREEVIRATIVVLTTMVFLGVILLSYDFIWSWFLRLIGVLQY